MSRIDALIALVSGSTLAGFVGLVTYAVLTAVGVFGAGGVSAGDSAGYGADVVDAITPNSAVEPATYARHTATLDNGTVSYLDFGARTALSEHGAVAVAPIWVFIDGFDADGAPRMIPDHPTVLDAMPDDPGYSDLWDVRFVLVPDGFDSRAIHSLEDLDASGLQVIPAGMLVNCPIVDGDATTSEGHPVRAGWYRDQQVHYFDLGVSAVEPGTIYEFVLADDPALGGYATPAPLAVPPLVVLPEAQGPAAQFFRLYQVEVNDESVAAATGSAADLEAGGFWIRATGQLVNRPLITD